MIGFLWASEWHMMVFRVRGWNEIFLFQALKSPLIAHNYGQILFLENTKINFLDFWNDW